MRLVVSELLTAIGIGIDDTRTEHHGPRKGPKAAGDVNGTGTGKIVNPEFV